MSETVKENIAQTVLLFIKNNLALLSAFIFLCFSLFDLYVFKETFHMNGAVFFNRVLPNAFGSFSQFWPYLFLPIIKVLFTLGFFYAWQFFSLDAIFKFIKNHIENNRFLIELKNLNWSSEPKKLSFKDFQYQFDKFCKKSNKITRFIYQIIYILGALLADIFLLLALYKSYGHLPLSLSLYLLYSSLIINNLFTMVLVSYFVLTNKHNKKSDFNLIYGLSAYLFGKLVFSLILIYFDLDFIGIYIIFNAFVFIFFFLFGVFLFNGIKIFKININWEIKKDLGDFATKLISLFLIIPVGLFIFQININNLLAIPYQKKDFWATIENKDATSLPLANFSNLFSPAKIEIMSEENKYNFSPVQQKRITEKYKNAFGKENNFFDQNLTHFSIPQGEKALIFLFDGEHAISVYAHVDELENNVKKIYDVGYIEISSKK